MSLENKINTYKNIFRIYRFHALILSIGMPICNKQLPNHFFETRACNL